MTLDPWLSKHENYAYVLIILTSIHFLHEMRSRGVSMKW